MALRCDLAALTATSAFRKIGSVPQFSVQVVCVLAAEIADKLGSAKVANVVMMGALLEETECLASSTAVQVLEAKVKNPALLDLDRKALDAGHLYIDHTVAVGAVTQADGFAQ
jgi:Pyruvate/2-oxoacid:ferredoxin oxidoreductase gamma subunit